MMGEYKGCLTLMVAVMMVMSSYAIPTTQPQGTNPTKEANHVEDQYLDDALGNWLENFGAYTFLVKQGLDTHQHDHDHADEESPEGTEQVDSEAAVDVAQEEEEEEEEADMTRSHEEEEKEEEEEEEGVEEWSAPIAVFTGSKNLLDPRRDYLVTVESLVAEEGSIFLTLSKYENQTTCGVGGVTQEEAHSKQPPRRHTTFTSGATQPPTTTTTAIPINDQDTQPIAIESDVSVTDSSKWLDVSEQFWWARGQLSGGGMLSITYTPPECGCLALSTYFALPVGNVTLVVGPQAYPDELLTLLCVDPLPGVSDQEYDHEEEDEEEEAGDFSQLPSALARVASRNPEEEGEADDTENHEEAQQPTVPSRKKPMSREEKKMARKAKRQMKRQRIRQAGRRQAGRQRAPGGRRVGRRVNRKRNQRKRGKVWKKLHNRGRKGRRRFPGKHNHHHHAENDTMLEDTTEDDSPDHHNTTASTQQEERLVDVLLRDLYEGNTTSDDGTGDDSDLTEGEEAMAGEEVVGEGVEEPQTPRQRKKNRRQRKKQLRKQRRKIHPPGVKFCCKQGVKHKKNLLEVNSTSGNSSVSCGSSIAVVSTFANHQFGIEEQTCTVTYTHCCQRFSAEMWDDMKAKKEARRAERKQRRKSRRQGRKQRRRQERRHRKGKRRPHHHQEETKE